jgi:predicted transposase YbfD/YdcC
MAEEQYSTLMDAITQVPDPRKRRGKRYPWPLLLTILVSGLASGYQTARAIAQWAQLHADELRQWLTDLSQIPSESTVLRTLRQLDAVTLERLVICYTASLPTASNLDGCIVTPHGEVLQGQALDGKCVRGATAHGDATHLVSLVQHGTAITLAQTEIALKHNEISATPALLRGRDLSGTVTTMDALLTQRALAQQIVDQHGHYLMVVKRNQRRLWEDLDVFFHIPSKPADQEVWDQVTTLSKGHGRLETRTLSCSTGLVDYLGWPGGAQVICRSCERLIIKSGKRTRDVSYGITSLTVADARAAHLEALWRGHWTIENGKHYVRDVTLGEDANQMHTGDAPRVLATLRSGLIDLWRSLGWTNIADAVRDCAGSLKRTLTVIGALPSATLT